MTDRVISGSVTETSPVVLTGSDRIVFDPLVTSTLGLPNLLLFGSSQLVMQPSRASIKHSLLLNFPAAMEAKFVGGPFTDAVGLSDAGVWVRDNASVHLAGRRPTPMLHMVTTSANVLTLDRRPYGWMRGDVIVICPSASGDTANFEERTVTRVIGRLVTVDKPLTFQHPRVELELGLYAYPEVLHVERNVELKGLDGHPHMHIQSTAKQEMSGVCWENFGVPRDDVLGRYPVHLHHSVDANRGSVFSHLVVQHSGQRAFVPHQSHGITWVGAVAYDVNREAFWWDPAMPPEKTETNDNAWLNCVAAKVTGNHNNMASFELRNGTGNKAVSCVAVGNTGRTESAGFSWPTNANGTWLFSNCVAHNNKGHGAWVWQNTGTDHLLTNFVAYHNGKAGIHEGSYLNHYVTEGGHLVGNTNGGIIQTAVSDNRGVEPLTYRDVHIDAQQQSDWAIAFSPPESSFSDPRKSHEVHYERVSMTGYRRFAIMFVPGAKTPNGPKAIFENCTVDDLKTLCWFADWLDPETYIVWDGMVIVPANDARAGTTHPEWNARVLT